MGDGTECVSVRIGEVERLRASVQIQYTLATLGADRFWKLLQSDGNINSLGALTGNRLCSRSTLA
jgi:isocitrate lyase